MGKLPESFAQHGEHQPETLLALANLGLESLERGCGLGVGHARLTLAAQARLGTPRVSGSLTDYSPRRWVGGSIHWGPQWIDRNAALLRQI